MPASVRQMRHPGRSVGVRPRISPWLCPPCRAALATGGVGGAPLCRRPWQERVRWPGWLPALARTPAVASRLRLGRRRRRHRTEPRRLRRTRRSRTAKTAARAYPLRFGPGAATAPPLICWVRWKHTSKTPAKCWTRPGNSRWTATSQSAALHGHSTRPAPPAVACPWTTPTRPCVDRTTIRHIFFCRCPRGHADASA